MIYIVVPAYNEEKSIGRDMARDSQSRDTRLDRLAE